MKVAVVFVSILVALVSARVVDHETYAKEVCYAPYGCFSTEAPWTSLIRPIRALPKAPYETGTRFILFTRGTRESEPAGYELMPDKDAILRFSDFDASRKTYILIHGFTDNHRVDWIWNTKDLLLQNEDVNIIAVDWRNGARPPYLQSTANARIVGAIIARMITYLEQKAELKADDIHVIAHSLGSHVAGYAGDRLLGRIARITAIDPMDLYFGGTDAIVRLDTSDAKFVEVIHSNAAALTNLGLGIPGAIGHVDLYPNGGSKQPGCKDTLGNLIISIIDLVTLNFEGAISTWACSHARAAHYYAKSISDADACPFVSFPCKSFSDFEKGNCYQQCSEPGKCAPLGYNAKKHDGAAGTYYLRTNDGANNQTYCNQVVQVVAPVSLGQQKTLGTLAITFSSQDGTSSQKFLLADGIRMSAGQILSTWIEVPQSILRNPDDRPTVTLRYTRGGIPANQAKTLTLDFVSLNLIKPDLTTLTTTYQGVTLDYATDTEISV